MRCCVSRAKHLVLYVGTDRLLAVEATQGADPRTHAERIDSWTANALSLALNTLATSLTATGKDARCSIFVSPCWIGHACLPWSTEWTSLKSAKLAARDFLESVGIELKPDDRVQIGDGSWGASRLITSWPGSICEALERFCTELACRKVEILDLSAAIVEFRRPERDGVSIIIEHAQGGLDWYSFGRRESSVMVDEASRLIGLSDTIAPVMDQLQRLGWIKGEEFIDESSILDLRLEDSDLAARLLTWSKSTAKNVGAPGIGRGSTTNAARTASWITLAIGAVMTAGLLMQATRYSTMSAEITANYAGTTNAQNKEIFKPTEAQAKKIRAVNSAVRDLNLPLRSIFKQLVPPQDIAVGLVGLEVVSSSANDDLQMLKITAESRDPIDMTRYVAYVSSKSHFVSANLTKHELTEGSATRTPKVYKFQLEASWRP